MTEIKIFKIDRTFDDIDNLYDATCVDPKGKRCNIALDLITPIEN